VCVCVCDPTTEEKKKKKKKKSEDRKIPGSCWLARLTQLDVLQAQGEPVSKNKVKKQLKKMLAIDATNT
jgi:phosphoribosyl-dephospho-CoA transferase